MGLQEYEPQLNKEKQLEKRLSAATDTAEVINQVLLNASATESLSPSGTDFTYTRPDTGNELTSFEAYSTVLNVEGVPFEVSEMLFEDADSPTGASRAYGVRTNSGDALPRRKSRLADRRKDSSIEPVDPLRDFALVLFMDPEGPKDNFDPEVGRVQHFDLMISTADEKVAHITNTEQRIVGPTGEQHDFDMNVSAFISRIKLNLAHSLDKPE